MVNTAATLSLDGLDPTLHGPLGAATEAWSALLGSDLQGLTVAGSCLTPDYRSGRSDINTVLLLADITGPVLEALAGSLRPLRRRARFALPLLMTTDYIARSRDVFGIEFLDLQLCHRTLLGPDPFADLVLGKPDVRLQCERELKADLIRLRQGFVAAAGKGTPLREVLIAGVKSLLPLLRALLWLHDSPRDPSIAATLDQAAETLGLDPAPLRRVVAWWKEGARDPKPQVRASFTQVYELVTALAEHVDGLEVTP